MARSGFRWENTALFEQNRALNERIDGMIGTAVDYYATRSEAYARTNASWTDRTGNARNGLAAEAEHVQFRYHEIVISHGVPYGIWLETRFQGRNAIIEKTERHITPQLMNLIARRWPSVAGGGSE